MLPSGLLPSGQVTFVFTDIEDSTGLALRLGDAYPGVLRHHRQLVRAALRSGGGVEVDCLGDACFFAFAQARAAVVACRGVQDALAATRWPVPDTAPRVRIGLHTGDARPTGDEYASAEVHRAARVTAAAHGGQVLCSQAAARCAAPLPADLSVRELGAYRLRGFESPERLYQLVAPGWAAGFPAPRAQRVAPARQGAGIRAGTALRVPVAA